MGKDKRNEGKNERGEGGRTAAEGHRDSVRWRVITSDDCPSFSITLSATWGDELYTSLGICKAALYTYGVQCLCVT